MESCDKEAIISGQRPTWADIDLNALVANFHQVRRRVAPGVKVMTMVKANAYGHGAVTCARRLAAEGADWFGVAMPEEGIALRESGIRQPILCLGGFWEGQVGACVQYDLVPVVYRLDMTEALNTAAGAAGVVRDVHVKVDTGMGRLGVRYEAVRDFAEKLKSFTNIRVDGVMTHFATADEEESVSFTREQIARYREAVNVFRERGHRPTFEDLANSAGIFAHPASWGNMVRPGGVLYGLWRDVLPPLPDSPQLRPVMSLRSSITLLKRINKGETLGYGRTFTAPRETLVATLPIGYHDGYMRALSNRGRVIVRGSYAPIVGRVSMDLTMVDVTDIEGITTGNVVTLFGEGDGLAIAAEDVAKEAGTISYELTCGISERVPRRFLPS
ncbi:MAG TPA: alanine racemase [Pyrinomonadaceae bacterium]|nr:alanine racemase [Pyrinomonadaceae bacterium]